MARLKSAWDKLSMNERALFIKLSLLHGLSNLKDIRDTYNMYIDKLQNSAENYYNGVVYSIMSLRPGTDRSVTDIGEALLHPNKKGMYSGNIGEGGWPNWDRDLLKLYLNKDTTGFTEIDPHDSEYKGSYNYNTNDSSIKSYKGDLIIGHEPNVSPAIYQLAKDMAKDNIKILRNMDKDIIFNYNDYKLNRDRGVREEDWDYHMQPGEFVDDVRRYKRNYTLSNDEPVIQASKMWDFTPHNSMGLMEKIKSNMLSSAGSPFILRDAQKLLLSNSDDLYTRVLNTSILEDALDNNVMIKNKDNTLSPLTIFPEIFVHPQSQDWDYYLPSNNIPKDELPTLTDDAVISIDPTYKTVVNDIFKDTPLVGHYITINNMDVYPYTGYKTLHDEATRTSYNDGGQLTHKKSTGGPIYPFSFEKNPFLKTPIVRYDEGGHLFGFGDWLTNLFNPTDTTTTVNTEPAPLDLGELATRQAYAESQFDSNAVSPANAVGLFLVTPTTLDYYNSKTGNTFTTQDLYDDTINQLVRDWYMDDLMNRPWNTKNNPSDSVQYAKSLGAYNWGPTNLVDTLNKAKADGVDIYNSWDWLTYLPTETRDYINFVLRNLNNSVHRNNMMYNRATDKYLSKVSAIKSSK